MNYIARYIPLNGEIKVGDRVQSESFHKNKVLVTGITEKGDYITDERDIWEFDSYFIMSKDKAKKFSKNLYLVSRDIKVGDRVFGDMTVGGIDSNGYWVNSITPIADGGHYERDVFKVIGEISSDAVWVKEGDEFDEDEIHKCFVPDKGNPMIRQVKIKCPCCNTYK